MFKFVKEMFFSILVISSTFFIASEEAQRSAQGSPSILSQTEFRTPQDKFALFAALGLCYTQKLTPLEFMKHQRELNCCRFSESIKNQAYHEYLQNMVERNFIAPTSIKLVNSKIGYGLFAQKKIFKGLFVGEYTGQITSENDCSSGVYAWDYQVFNASNDNLNEYVIDASTSGNETRFVNDDGIDSNCVSFHIAGKDDIPHIVYVTLRDIKAGEQLTIDYGHEYWEDRRDFQDLTLKSCLKVK